MHDGVRYLILALIVLLGSCLVVLLSQALASLGSLLVRLLLSSATLFLLRAVLLGDFILHDVDRASFEFLSDLFLLALPGVLYPLAAVTLVLSDNLVFVLAIQLWDELQVEKRIVQNFKVL